MSQLQTATTYEGVLELIRQVTEQIKATDLIVQKNAEQMKVTDARIDRKFQETAEQMKAHTAETDRKIQETTEQIKKTSEQMRETDRKIQETTEQIEKTNQNVGGLSSSVGELVASMVKGNIVEKFQALGYDNLDDCCQKKEFKNSKLGIKGEIDLFIENGDIAILVEVKTTLETADVRKHIERLEKFRRYTDARGVDQRRFIGAVAGAIVEDAAANFALENGLYVIVQSGEAVEILPPPEGFVVKKW